MANMSLKKNPMPSQEPDVRNKNFDEVALGYTEEMAIDEAKRCLNCKNPKCVNGCPVNVHIPEFIAKVAEGKFDEAFGVITSTNSLPAICGRVCPQENQCEGQCIRGIKGEPVGIGRLERFVADYHNAHGHQGGAPAVPESNGHKVAVVGSGPAGLTCAGDLARKGYDVTVFEALHQVGGVLVYGIPEFRLPKAIVAKEVARLEHFGVKIMTDTVVGRTITVDELIRLASDVRVAGMIGGKAGIMEVDDVARAWLEGRCQRPPVEYHADPDAEYARVVRIDAADIKPCVSWPHLPSNTHPVSESGHIAIDQAVIGSCTNGRIEDMRAAAEVLRGRRVAEGVRCIVIPATQAVFKQCMAEGLADAFIDAGCVFSTPTCGPCLGGYMGILAAGERCVSTTNRNFVGRMGDPTSEVYLASPAVAAASAVAGRICAPSDL